MKTFKNEKINIYNEDCMKLMQRYEDNYFDLAIVDPPYGINADKAQNKQAENRKKANGKSKTGRGWKEYKPSNWDNSTPKKEYFEELFRVSKNQIIWGGNYFPFIWNYSNSFLIWNKMQREFTLADGEMAWYSVKQKAMRIFDFSRGEALADNNKNGGRFHPTQKPVKLYEWLLMNYAKEGDKILDTHLGSGSIAIACHNLKFELTGSELDEEYFDSFVKRYKQHTAQIQLF
jgi:site-specific DNA-methyltransferase (adenine-specific)